MSRRFPLKVKQCLEKSRDSALLAIETYNRPAVRFKSGGFVILMVISWTSLFHAHFFLKGKKPYYRKKTHSGHFETREGDYFYWDLQKCLDEYYGNDTQNPVRKNLEFFIPLRNKIEHKSLPELDADLFAECQAMLLNYDRVVEKEFGSQFCMRECLSFSLQLFPRVDSLGDAVRANPDAKKIKKFIDQYRSAISTEVMNSGQYSFKAFLVQVANHDSAEALPIQFYRFDDLSEEEKKNVGRFAALVRYKEKAVSGKGMLMPAQVVKRVQAGLGNPQIDRNGKQADKFHATSHTLCWKKYKVRPPSDDPKPANTLDTYCVFDEPTGTYRYTEEWVKFLLEKMSDEEEYNSL